MRFVYNVLFTFFFLLCSPFYFLKMVRRGNWKRDFAQRFARYDAKLKQAITNRHVLWIHAVSVGEVNMATHLIRALELRAPNLKIVVSTTTSTGMEQLKKLPSHISRIYFPIDRRPYAARALRVFNPEAIVLVEAEVWPNFLWAARRRKIPVFLVNARMSNRSFPRYRLAGFLFRDLFAQMAGVTVQNESDGQKMLKLGVRKEALRVVGNLKFDAAKVNERPLVSARDLLTRLGVQEDTMILLGGSTHAGEELMLAEIFQRLKPKFPKLFLVIVPRHFERGKEVGDQLTQKGLKFVYRSLLTPQSSYRPGEVEALLVNTTGELRNFYNEADVIFVGKSITAEGGQNPIEPAALGKAVVFGPNMQNFTAIADAFLKAKAAVQARDAATLETAIADLLANEDKRAELGRNALVVVQQNEGAVERTVDMIVHAFKDEDIYVAPKPTV
ncbi:MAG TPA: 3-deoxy-D-manno-octulosonic acid transferase [Methylomirabilota bacterium]|nr:3-deoxy-D-manno-octulosonic acid transferase [Methylomirabilota bacterium]